MKNILLLIGVLFLCYTTQAQHRISLYGGWNISKIQSKLPSNATPGPIYQDLFAFPPLNATYFAIEYEYHLKPLRFSTGILHSVFGTSEFFFKDPWSTGYYAIPLMVARDWDICKNTTLGIKGGVELALEVDYKYNPYQSKEPIWGAVFGAIGVEANWKRFRLGSMLRVGLTEFRNDNGFVLRHAGITTYIGYTIFDSEKAKVKKVRRLERKATQ